MTNIAASAPGADLKDYGRNGAVKALRDENAIFRALTDSLPQMVWSTQPNGLNDYFNVRWYEFTGLSEGASEGDRWSEAFHPDFAEEAVRRWTHSVETGEPYEIEHKLRHRDGGYRWVVTRGLPVRDGSGAIVRWIGTSTDIDRAKRNAEQNEILSRELSHRIKNIFAVIGGLIGLSSRRHPEARDYARELQGRIAALARAHEFVRPHSEESQPLVGPSTLHAMLRDLFEPYTALTEGRLTIAGDDLEIDDRGATPIALVFHELATNAAKYGALSRAEGRVEIESQWDGRELCVSWRERGGPEIEREPERRGFGTQLAELSIAQQLGGSIARSWAREGLEVAIRVPAKRLTRG